MKIRTVSTALACLTLAACSTTTPPPASTRQMSTYDMATEYTVDYVADGFTLTVNYRYTDFVLRTSTAQAQCRSAVTHIANNLSERRQHPIAAIDEQKVRMVTTRKWSGAMATCAAVAQVSWRQSSPPK